MTAHPDPGHHGERSKTARTYDRVAQGRAIPGNHVTLHHEAPAGLDAMLATIAAARRWVHLDHYIIRDDRTGARFAEALGARARAGVAVRVLTDWVGSFGTGRRYWRALRQAGVEVRHFGPPTLRLIRNLSRDHRKVVVADGTVAVTGGICIGDEWAGDPAAGRLAWRDSAVRIEGPAAAAIDRAFARVWAETGPPLPDEELATEVPASGSAHVRVLAGEPGRSRLGPLTQLVLAGATTRAWLTDAYLVAPRPLVQALADAARDGVDVRILVPGTSDLPLIRNLTRIGYRDLLDAGVRIFEWGGPMLHAKSAVTDGRWTRIGSTNLNWSSLLGNWELDVVIEDAEISNQMEHAYRRDLDLSAEVTLRPLRAPERLGRLLPRALRRTGPGHLPPVHHPGPRERRKRRLVALLTLAGSARRAVFGTGALVLLALAVLAFVVPRAVGILFGALSLGLALLVGRGAVETGAAPGGSGPPLPAPGAPRATVPPDPASDP